MCIVTLLSLQVYELKIYQLLLRRVVAQRPRDGILFTRQYVHVFATECPQAGTDPKSFSSAVFFFFKIYLLLVPSAWLVSLTLVQSMGSKWEGE